MRSCLRPVGQYPGPCFDLILRSASFAARLMSAAERSSIRFASLNSWGLIGRGLRVTPVPVGNLRSEILVVQSAQNWHRQRATDSLDGTRDRRVLVHR